MAAGTLEGSEGPSVLKRLQLRTGLSLPHHKLQFPVPTVTPPRPRHRFREQDHRTTRLRAHGIDRFGVKWATTSWEKQVRAATPAQCLGSQAPNLEHCLLPSQIPGIRESQERHAWSQGHCPQKRPLGQRPRFISSRQSTLNQIHNHRGFNSQSLLTKTFLNECSKISVLNEKVARLSIMNSYPVRRLTAKRAWAASCGEQCPDPGAPWGSHSRPSLSLTS